MRSTAWLRVLIGAALLLLAACDSGDGRTLTPPGEGDATPRTTVPLTVPATTLDDSELRLTSPAFEDGGAIPAVHSLRDGEDLSPPLVWAGAPEGTQELALVVTDVDAGGFVHWVVTGLPPSTERLDPGIVPPEAVEAVNDYGSVGWGGPAPVGGRHTYRFRLHALSTALAVEPERPADEVIGQIEGATLATAELFGTYE